MKWGDVGSWLKEHAGPGAALVGSLLSGNVPGALAAGVALVSTATGEATPEKVMEALQSNPATVLRLRELAVQDEQNIRQHIQAMAEIEAKDAQASHEQTQLTIRSGDNSADPLVRRTRPLQSWASLLAAFGYVAWREVQAKDISIEILMVLLTLPWAYAGLREIGKGFSVFSASRRGASK